MNCRMSKITIKNLIPKNKNTLLRPDGILQVREVAALLGISRTRVAQLEKEALNKIVDLFSRQGIKSLNDFQEKEIPKVELSGSSLDLISNHKTKKTDLCWIDKTKIVSLNCGSEDPWDIARSFAFLRGQRKNERLPSPPVFQTEDGKLYQNGYIYGMNVINENLSLALKDYKKPKLDLGFLFI